MPLSSQGRVLLLACLTACCGCGTLGSGWGRSPEAADAARRAALDEQLPGTSLPDDVPLDVDDDEEEGGFFNWLGRTDVIKGTRKLVGLGPDRDIAHRHWDEAEELFRQGHYRRAAKKYKAAAARWPDSPLEEDALFMMGESYFFADLYPKSSDTFANLLKKYDNSRHLHDISARQFAIARYWQEKHAADPHWPVTPNLTDRTMPWFDAQGNAIAVYKSIWMSDPIGPLADDSIMATANAYFLANRFEDADYHYSLLRRDFPKSEHQPAAHVLGLRAKLQKYQGPYYDGSPIEEAEELVEQALVQFPNLAAEERERLLQTKRAIAAQKAQRDYEMAQYYERTKHNRSAAIYYNEVVEEHPDTRYAELARSRLPEVESLPPEPPNRFAWLTDLFERDTKQR